jgi:serine/threonine protein kinase
MPQDSQSGFNGTVLLGRYLVSDAFSRGGQATIFGGTDLVTELPVVVKRFKLFVSGVDADDARNVERVFEREALQVAGLFGHPNIVSVLAFGVWPETNCAEDSAPDPVYGWIAFERLESDLCSFLNGKSFDTKLRVLADCARGLAYTHSRPCPVYHRDVKPANLLLSPGGTGKLGDFGLSVEAIVPNVAIGFSWESRVVGTFKYMAPELLAAALSQLESFSLGQLPRDIPGEVSLMAADVFAFGATAYEVLTETSYIAEWTREPSNLSAVGSVHSPTQLELARYYSQQKAILVDRPSNLSQPLFQMLRKCLEPSPKNRPNSADEVLAVLEAELIGRFQDRILKAHQRDGGGALTSSVDRIIIRAARSVPAVANVRAAICQKLKRAVEDIARDGAIHPSPWIDDRGVLDVPARRERQDWYCGVMLRPLPQHAGTYFQEARDVLVPVYFAHIVGAAAKHWAEWTDSSSDLQSSLRVGESCSGLPIEAERIEEGKQDRVSEWTDAEDSGALRIYRSDGRIDAIVLPKLAQARNGELGSAGELVKRRYVHHDNRGPFCRYRDQDRVEHSVPDDLSVEIVVPLYSSQPIGAHFTDEDILGVVNMEYQESLSMPRIVAIVRQVNSHFRDPKRFQLSRFLCEIVGHIAWDI